MTTISKFLSIQEKSNNPIYFSLLWIDGLLFILFPFFLYFPLNAIMLAVDHL
jgi:hypothetical protein